MTLRITVIFLLGVAITIGVYQVIFSDSNAPKAPGAAQVETNHEEVGSHSGQTQERPGNADVPSTEGRVGDVDVVVLATSIYDFDLDFQQRAQSAAEASVARLGQDAVSRWRPVHVDPMSVLRGSYLRPDAMPERLLVSPFDHLTFEITQTNYRVEEAIETAGWEGQLVGEYSGRADLTIVGGEANPEFVLKIISVSGDQAMVYSIVPTEVPNAYVAVEGNPHRKIDHSH